MVAFFQQKMNTIANNFAFKNRYQPFLAMKITTHFKKMKTESPTAIAIGSFDGVHLGHQAIIKKLRSIASQNNLIPFVLFFEPLPKEFFIGDKAPSRIYDFRNKILNIQKVGIENVICQKFNQKFASIEAESFIDFLTQKLNVKHIIIGDDFKFGKNRKGDFNLLKTLETEKDFTVDRVSTLNLDNHRVSSTDIRKAFKSQDINKIVELLGDSYKLNGRVIHGQQNGRKIGFHTANLKLPKNSVLKGVFLTRVTIDNQIYYGVTNAGTRPTVDGNNNLLETHIFDFNKDIYNKHITVEIISFIRSEKKFSSFAELKEQITKDTQIAKKMITSL